jgi:hypothetical protein
MLEPIVVNPPPPSVWARALLAGSLAFASLAVGLLTVSF